ncbi:MAG: L-aspartate oxidase [Actinomycetes bacterium]
MNAELDLLVVGSGVAGLSAAVRAAAQLGVRVGVLTKGPLEQSTTRWAQGGVAAVLGGDPDSTDLHLADTLAAGAGLCDVDAVRVLVEEGPIRVRDLVALGARFDRDADGKFELAREGGHSLPRIVHAGGVATGAEIERALVAAVRSEATEIHEHAFALDLVIENARCVGIRAALADGTVEVIGARNILLASGGAGQVFSVTTNPLEATGDGIAMALRAGAAVADVEFVQFHPTALHHPRMPRPLLSEALRGHGALILDINGERFVDEMLPRDQVSRAMVRQMIKLHTDHCLLDVSGLDDFNVRFPTIAAMLTGLGFDPATDLLPIAPAAHYLCGGIVTDLNGASSVPGLWAAGEVACSGVHGANRLASNSLLEGMVFGARVIEAIESGVNGPEMTGAMRALDGVGGRQLEGWTAPQALATVTSGDDVAIAVARDDMQWAMTVGAGVVRDQVSLEATMAKVGHARGVSDVTGIAAWELSNLTAVASALLAAADARTESRGAHTRDDWPETDPNLALRLVIV